MASVQPDSPSLRAGLPSTAPTKSFWQSSHPNPLVNHRSTSSLPPSTDVIIIGSGITAAFAALELLENSPSTRVLVLEARTTCSGATGRNGGHLIALINESPSHIIDFEASNFDDIKSLIETHNVPCDFRELHGCQAFWEPELFEEQQEFLSKHYPEGSKHEELFSITQDAHKLEQMRLKGALGAITIMKAASLSPYKLIIWLWTHMLDKYGSRLNLQTTRPVTKISRSSDGNVVFTKREEQDEHGVLYLRQESVAAQQVILCTNGYTSHLLPRFTGIITPTPGQMTALIPPESFQGKILPMSYGLNGMGKKFPYLGDYLIQRPPEIGGHLMYGGARRALKDGGSGVSDDSYNEDVAVDSLKTLPQRIDFGSVGSNAKIELKELKIEAAWTGIMGYSRDGHPWVGALPGHAGVWLAGGYTGHGMPNASGCGRHIARLVVDAIDGKDWHARERQAVADRALPGEYVLSEERLGRVEAVLR